MFFDNHMGILSDISKTYVKIRFTDGKLRKYRGNEIKKISYKRHHQYSGQPAVDAVQHVVADGPPVGAAGPPVVADVPPVVAPVVEPVVAPVPFQPAQFAVQPAQDKSAQFAVQPDAQDQPGPNTEYAVAGDQFARTLVAPVPIKDAQFEVQLDPDDQFAKTVPLKEFAAVPSIDNTVVDQIAATLKRVVPIDQTIVAKDDQDKHDQVFDTTQVDETVDKPENSQDEYKVDYSSLDATNVAI